MSNVMSLKGFSNKVKRNGFDLSFKNAFTAKAGELLPIFTKEVIPGDKFKVNGQAFTRTQPLMSAAFVRMREYFDFYFVPYRLLWNRANQFFTNMPDFHHATSILGQGITSDRHPYFTYNDVIKYLNAMDIESTGKKNYLGYNRALLTCKLMEYLGYTSFMDNDVDRTLNSELTTDIVLNPFPLLAYQKVYQDFFRWDVWENAAAYRYNLDYIQNSSSLHLDISSIYTGQSSVSYNLFDLNYCNWQKDYFMGLLPSPQYGSESIAVIGKGLLSGLIQSADDPSSTWNISFLVGAGSSPNSNSAGVSILALRQAEAMQKWREIAQSGRMDYKTQMEKHFDVSPSDVLSDHCRYLGGWTSNLDINAVTNTNLSAIDAQSDLRGNGTFSSDGNINFEAKEHGIIMGIYHCMPLLDYNLDGIIKLNLKTNFTDYAIPEFDSIGMQQVDTIELSVKQYRDGWASDGLGFAPRYVDYKTSYDIVHGAFRTTLPYWVAPITHDYLFNAMNNPTDAIDYTFFKVTPALLDNLFGVNADSTVDTDQFLINCFFDVKAVRNLDYNGLPY